MIKLFLIVFILSNVLSLSQSYEFNSTICSCDYDDLVDIENLNSEYKRIRIDSSNGTRKFDPIFEMNNTNMTNIKIGCKSLVLYEVMDKGNSKLQKKCRVCTRLGWSDIKTCDLIRCDRDLLIGKPILRETYNKEISDDVKLFLPGTVIAEYKFGDTKLCKECHQDGEWSKFSDSSICKELTTPKPKEDCRYDALKDLEYNQLDYVRVRVESPDGLYKIEESHILDNKLPSNTVVVYQRYLSNLPNAINRLTELDLNYYSFNVFTKKFCRYCQDGVWSELESCVELSCDRELLYGAPDLLTIPKYFRLPDKQTLIKPYTAIAQFTFGSSDKFCKQCHENGEWSKYSLAELCDLKTYDVFKTPLSNEGVKKSRNYMWPRARQQHLEFREIYKKESSCDHQSLYAIEAQYPNLSRVYFVSSDRRSKLNPSFDAKLPSRTLSLYKHTMEEKINNKHHCSLCINGVWSSISTDCTTDSSLYFCEKEMLNNSGVIRLVDDEPWKERQNLFQPGTVMVAYDISDDTRLCKVCLLKNERAEWSKYAETSLCNPNVAFSKINSVLRNRALKAESTFFCNRIDVDNPNVISNFTLESIQSWDGRREFEKMLSMVPESSMAIFLSKSTEKSLTSLKWCKKCVAGRWDASFSPCRIEFAIKKCDPTRLLGVDYFVYAADGTRLEHEEATMLVLPGKVFAVYEFGNIKYCKSCDDGEWSSYPQYNLCNLINWN